MKFRSYPVKIISVILTVLIFFSSVTGIALATTESQAAVTTTAVAEVAEVVESTDVTETPEEDKKLTADDIINKIVDVARAEEGFFESGVNKFTLWYYGREIDAYWCTIFVSWCATQAGAIKTAIPRRNTCSSMKNWFERRGEYHTADSGYIPQKGDIAFLNTEGDGTDNVHHVEIVTEDGFVEIKGVNHIRAIGGNTSDVNYNGSEYVTEKTRPVVSERALVVGYANPSYEKSVGCIGRYNTARQQNMLPFTSYLYSRMIALIYNCEIMWANFISIF